MAENRIIGLTFRSNILFSLLCLGYTRSQVNIIGMPRSELNVDLTIKNGSGSEIDTRRPLGPYPVGTTLTIFCETKHPVISHLAWSRDGIEYYGTVSRFSDGLLQNELKLTISPADKSSEYKCRGLNLRYDPVVEKSVRLEIRDQAQVSFSASILPLNGTFKANDTVSLRCLAQGSRGPAIITWWKDNRLMNETNVSATPGITVRNGITNTESYLTFKAATTDDGVTIFCRAMSALSQMNENATAEATLKLEIYYLPYAHITRNDTIFSKENGPINIPCSIRAHPSVDKVRWYRNDKLIYEDKMKNPLTPPSANDSITTTTSIPSFSDLQTNALRILQVSRGDVGMYSCEAHNSAGWGPRSNQVEVKVQYKPGPAKTAKQQTSTEVHAAEGEKVTLTCSVADPGNPPSFTFIWRKEGAFLSRGHVHTINSVHDKHFGLYTCAPYNGAGEGDAASINLTRKVEEPVLQSAESNLLIGASVTGIVAGTILLAIVIWCLCSSKTCRRNKQVRKAKVNGPDVHK
ncbi:hypothetical protein RvY_01258-2 [Ramazzottius varieornatus]|uniref:Ig-like domain-containing protein n=1 Tax=Ramazzottius varieornatus TaxID=947166 RepID=A0A1D1ULR3_RAMVA|nr:hypothetical protein RvY_01258-2 [Ramazzottius varieornatus]